MPKIFIQKWSIISKNGGLFPSVSSEKIAETSIWAAKIEKGSSLAIDWVSKKMIFKTKFKTTNKMGMKYLTEFSLLKKLDFIFDF